MESSNRLFFALFVSILLTCVASAVPQARNNDASSKFQVSLRKSGNHFCSGAIISYSWVVTTSECIKDVSVDEIQIVYGTTRLSVQEPSMKVFKIFKHPNYNEGLKENNIAMLLTATKFNLTIGKLIAIHNKVAVEGDAVIVSGWGVPDKGNESIHFSDVLNSQNTTVISTEKCRTDSGDLAQYVHDSITLCTENAVGQSVCAGDLGGPLIANDDNRRLIGIVSWNTGCAEGKPDGYTAMDPYFDWMHDLVAYNHAN